MKIKRGHGGTDTRGGIGGLNCWLRSLHYVRCSSLRTDVRYTRCHCRSITPARLVGIFVADSTNTSISIDIVLYPRLLSRYHFTRVGHNSAVTTPVHHCNSIAVRPQRGGESSIPKLGSARWWNLIADCRSLQVVHTLSTTLLPYV